MRTIEIEIGLVRLIDQRKLPVTVEILNCCDHRQIAEAIRSLAVRGAPAIGVAAAAGLALAAHELRKQDSTVFWQALEEAAQFLRATRPTAVNLFWAVHRTMAFARGLEGHPPAQISDALWTYASQLADEDVETNRLMAAYGQVLIQDGDGVLTHCNTGALATVDIGTAFGVVRAAHAAGKQIHLWIDETRPVLQGARLTAWEAVANEIPATLITDNMAAHFMKQGRIQIAFVGADRIAANGDTANKIGTYSVAVNCREHGIPFFVVAPSSTFDLSITDGGQIPIEERQHDEVTHIGGVRVAPEGIAVANPAFDVTPARYICGIVTEKGIVYPPFTVNIRRTLQGGE